MKNSNVAIDQTTNEILTEFCSRTKLTKKDFITISLTYFNEYSINPAKYEKPTQEDNSFLEHVLKNTEAVEKTQQMITFFVNKQKENEKQYMMILGELQKNHQAEKVILKNTQQQLQDVILKLGLALENKNKGIFEQLKNSF